MAFSCSCFEQESCNRPPPNDKNHEILKKPSRKSHKKNLLRPRIPVHRRLSFNDLPLSLGGIIALFLLLVINLKAGVV